MKTIAELLSDLKILRDLISKRDSLNAERTNKTSDVQAGSSINSAETDIKKLITDLKPVYRQAIDGWEKFIGKKAVDKYGDWIAAIKPFYPDYSDGKLRSEFNQSDIPIIQAIRRSAYSGRDISAASAEVFEYEANQFVAHMKRCCEKFGWSETEFETPFAQ